MRETSRGRARRGIACLALALCAGQPRVTHAQGAYPIPPDFAVPADSLIPVGPLGDAIRRGRGIVTATRDSLPGHVGNRLVCTNCHREAGTKASSGSWVGSYASFPQYNARAGRVIRIEDRINECLRRSLNGKPLADTSRAMTDIVAYMAFLSSGTPHGVRPLWVVYQKLAARPGDAARGDTIYAAQCARCHGPRGEGSAIAPPAWGPQSFAIGAGMSRLNTIAAFIRWNMPFDRPASLDDQQAYDVASFILTHSRPDTPGKERDWPNGDPPGDAAYPTLAGRKGAASAH